MIIQIAILAVYRKMNTFVVLVLGWRYALHIFRLHDYKFMNSRQIPTFQNKKGAVGWKEPSWNKYEKEIVRQV